MDREGTGEAIAWLADVKHWEDDSLSGSESRLHAMETVAQEREDQLVHLE